MKEQTEIDLNPKATYYAVLYADFRKAAMECGYALAVHGSMARDMDLIAVAWTEDAQSPEVLVSKINDCIGETVWKERNLTDYKQKPHGRLSYTISIMGDWFIDLSIIPPRRPDEFIGIIRNSFIGSEVVYTRGSCYRFYEILKFVFPNANAYYNSDHVITEINGRFYDITGEVEKTNHLLMSEHYPDSGVKDQRFLMNDKVSEVIAEKFSEALKRNYRLEKLIEGYKAAVDSLYEDKSFTEHENLRHK